MKIKGVLIDLDGVMYNNEDIIPGAVETIKWLRDQCIPFLFVTNTTRMNTAAIARHMNGLGIRSVPDEIISPPGAAAAYMKQHQFTSYHLLAHQELNIAFKDLEETDDSPNVVIVGDLGDILTFDRIDFAFRLLMGGADLLALHKDRFWQTEQGLRMDTGAMVTALEYASGKTATVVGKPERPFFDMAIKTLGLPPNQVVMIGDSIETDIGGAQRAGIEAILVRTGNYQFLSESESGVIPDHMIDSIADLPVLFS